MPDLRLLLNRVLAEYPTAARGAFTTHELAVVLRHDLAGEVASAIGDDYYKVKGSAGQGNWAVTPWVAVFDPAVTTSAERGYYVVYLFRSDGAGAFLSLNQGATSVWELAGRRYRSVLRANAVALRESLTPDVVRRTQGEVLDLPGTNRLTRGYAAANVAALYYPRDRVPEHSTLVEDLRRFLGLYRGVVEAGAALHSLTTEDIDDEGLTGVEAAKLRWHKSAERSRSLAMKAKRFHGYRCQVCSLRLIDRYGDIGSRYIEAHHLVPFRTLKARPTHINVKTDFAVVCANCHRMLHRADPPLTPTELRARLR